MGKNRKRHSQKKALNNLNSTNESVIQCLSYSNKLNGLVVGTNVVLKLLQKNCLSCVFLFSNKAAPPIYYFLSSRCASTNVPFFTLQENDRILLGSGFPCSITYGIKKECMSHHPKLNELLHTGQSSTNICTKNKSPSEVCHPVRLENVKGLDETVKSKNTGKQTFYHKKHLLEKNRTLVDITQQQDFLSLAEYSDSEEKFPVYKSVKWKKSELIIK